MSETVFSSGCMVPLAECVGNHSTVEWEELAERLDEKGLSINYEGTLIFNDNRREEIYGLTFPDSDASVDLIASAKELGIEIVEDQISPYACVWYNGADSDMSDLTLTNFLKATEQMPLAGAKEDG